MPKKKSKENGYFHTAEEEAFVKYLNTTGKEREDIFNKILYPAFVKLVSSVIRTYELYIPGEDFEFTFNDAMTFIISKADKFKPELGNKAYSYFGNMCKNYLLGRINAYNKSQMRYVWYDGMGENEFGENEFTDMASDETDGATHKRQLDRLMTELYNGVKNIVDHREELGLTEVEYVTGNALLSFLENWETLLSGEESNKFNRQTFLYYIREYTLLTTPKIHKGMKRYNALYEQLRENILT